MKIALIGGGSHFFEGVIIEIAQTPELHGASIALYDILPDSAELIAAVGRRYSDLYHAELELSVCKELGEALDGADAVISSIGVHGPAQAWHKLDVEAVASLGIMQTTGDSVGPTGISQGLRIIPTYLELATAMERYCPESTLLNHSNPMAAICRAVTKYTKIRTIGYCHNVSNAITKFARLLAVEPEELDALVGGVNHQVWLLSLLHKGKDVYPDLRARMAEETDHKDRLFTKELLEIFGLYLMGGDRHIIEFFPHARMATKPGEIGYDLQWRKEMIEGKRLSEELTLKASELTARAGGKAPLLEHTKLSPEAMGQQVRALTQGPDMVHIVNVPNQGAIGNLPEWAVIEMKCVVGQHGARPVQVGDLPAPAARWTLAQIYAHEIMIEAAAERSRSKAIQALACDPMVLNFSEPARILDALITAQDGRLDIFRKR